MADGTFSFGKHKGKTYSEVYEQDKGYFEWAENSARGNGGMLRGFLDFCRNKELDAVAPVPTEDMDIDEAVMLLLRRSGFDVEVSNQRYKRQKAIQKHREEVFDAEYQMTVKFVANGYSSAEEFARNEPEVMKFIRSKPDLPEIDEKAELEEIDKTKDIYQYAKTIIEVSRGVLGKTILQNLDNATRKQIHHMAKSFPDLEVGTFDRRNPKDTSKRQRHGPSIAKMYIEKKK